MHYAPWTPTRGHIPDIEAFRRLQKKALALSTSSERNAPNLAGMSQCRPWHASDASSDHSTLRECRQCGLQSKESDGRDLPLELSRAYHSITLLGNSLRGSVVQTRCRDLEMAGAVTHEAANALLMIAVAQ